MNRFDRFYNQGYNDAESLDGVLITKPAGYSEDDWRAYRAGRSQAEYDQRAEKDCASGN